MIEIKFIEQGLIDWPLIISILSPLIVGATTFWLAKRRYSYEKLFDRKLITLAEIYRMVILFEKSLNGYVFIKGHGTTEEKREEIKLVQDKFFELQSYFWENEIILDKNCVQKIQSFIDLSIEIGVNLSESIISQDFRDHTASHTQWNTARLLVKDKLPEIKKQLQDSFEETMRK